MKEFNENAKKLDQLKLEYASICERFNEVLENGELTVFTYKSIIEMSGKVVEAIARKYSKVKEGVKTIMGGRVLDFEAKRIRDQGRNECRVEGRTEGRMELLKQLIDRGILSPEEAAQF